MAGAQVGGRGPAEAPFDRSFVAAPDGVQRCEQGAQLLGGHAGRTSRRGARGYNILPEVFQGLDEFGKYFLLLIPVAVCVALVRRMTR